MNLDTELEAWRQEWQSDTDIPADLRRRVERQSFWMRVAMAGDILVTAVIGGGAIALAVRTPQPEMVLLAAVTWLFIATAWAFRLFSNRGLWTPSAVDTAAFVDLLIKRCHSKIAASIFGTVLYVSEIAFCLGWIYRLSPGALTPRFLSLIGAITLAFFAFLVWYRRKQRAELAWLLTLRG